MNTLAFERAPGPSRRNNGYRRPNASSGDAPSNSKTSQRRKKSRSPDAWNSQLQVAAQRSEPAQPEGGKKKKSTIPPPFDSRPFLAPLDDVNFERGRKHKSKSRQQGRQVVEYPVTASALAAENKPKKDRSKSRDSAYRQISKASTSDSEGVQALVDLHLEHQGPLAAAEFAKLKREIETWKKVSRLPSRLSSSDQRHRWLMTIRRPSRSRIRFVYALSFGRFIYGVIHRSSKSFARMRVQMRRLV